MGWVGSVKSWVGLGWVTENGPTSMSDPKSEVNDPLHYQKAGYGPANQISVSETIRKLPLIKA